MGKWNELYPDNQLINPPWIPGLTFGTTIAATRQHDFIEGGRHAGLQVGPAKDRLRVQAKLDEYREMKETCPDSDCLEKYVTDWLRARVVFTNPSALAVFFWYLIVEVPKFKVLVCKNKLRKAPGVQDTSCNIHINVQFKVQEDEHIGELQLI